MKKFIQKSKSYWRLVWKLRAVSWWFHCRTPTYKRKMREYLDGCRFFMLDGSLNGFMNPKSGGIMFTYRTSGLSPANLGAIFSELERLPEDTKKFLNQEFTFRKLKTRIQ